MGAEEATAGRDEPPEEPYELLELLESIIQDFSDHFKRRFQDRSDPQLTRRRLLMQLGELDLFLGEYIKQGSQVSKHLDATARQIAETLKSILHAGRIRDVLKIERLETKIATADNCTSGFATLEDFRTLISEVPKSRQVPFNRPIIKDMSTEVCAVLGSRISDFTYLLWCQNPQSKMTPQAARVSQPSRLRYSKKDFEGQPTCPHTILKELRRLQQPCQELLDTIRGWKLKIVATNINVSESIDFIPFEIDPPEPTRWITLQNVIDNRGIVFPPRERRFLAVILMYSFMQLLRSSWLGQRWGGTDIFFNSDGPTTVDLRRPYFSACWMASQSKARTVKPSDGYHPMPDMVTLARFLLELELQDTPFPPSIANSLPSDLLKASRLLGTLRELDRDVWAKALFLKSMEACLDPKTYTAHGSNLPQLLLWEIYHKVVSPLEQNLLSMLGPEATLDDLAKELSGASQLVNAISGAERSPTTTKPKSLLVTESDKWFKQLEDETHTFMRTVEMEEIRIAILDTGVDMSHPLLKSRIVVKDCWDFVEDSADICDEVGHGTHTTSLLARTAPRARIFCGRVWRKRREEKDTGKLVANAIEYAVKEWKAQIIVMPFAFPDIVTQIDDAIDEHCDKTLIFAAASNHNDRALGFPARHSDVIGVYSNKSASIQSEFCKLGREGGYNFSALGEEVEGAWLFDSADEEGASLRRETGTSCSTPIVAGVAALVLEFATLTGRVQVELAKKLRKKRVMEKVLFECMTDRHTSGGYNLLQPWKLLSGFDGKEPRRLQSVADAISAQIKKDTAG
ncbi:subtilisin-like protein [Thozetella sp. PMI_491]|nr:subtilisin-like protein [Thozetella sp. PMI_491]